MRILHICSYYYPNIGGIEQVARDVVGALKDNNEQLVFCFNHEKGNIEDEVDGVKVVRCNCQAKVASQSLSASYGRRLKKTIKSFGPDVIFFHYPNPFAAHYLLKYIKKDCKLVLYWHLDITKQKFLKKFFVGQNKRLLNRADKIVATSQNYIDGSPSLSVNREKCEVVPCCIHSNGFEVTEEAKNKAAKIREINGGKTICFALGRHVPYKGIEYLVRASKLLPDGYKIYIGGEGKLTESLKELAKADDKIEFLGKLPQEEVSAYFAACDVFCFPSITKNEAFGIALAEGMSYGKPAVTFTIEGSGVNYVSLNGVTGMEVENKNAQAFASAIEKLAGDETLRKTLGENAAKRVKENFTPEIFSAKIRALAEEL